ncbi:hypothetical protein SLS62_002352 [Diatrype stigma]|uniref:Velvet domain-containing protein n=1 Tax=Diatrype stigma TaxID=117547 RepID=A0AAN9UUG2_9PEZI
MVIYHTLPTLCLGFHPIYLQRNHKKPVDPPPILALVINDPVSSLHIQSPYLFVSAILEDTDTEKSGRKSPQGPPTQNALTGSTVSSLHKLKDIDNVETAFFVFGDLAVKKEGFYRIRFDLLQIDLMSREVAHLTSVLSDVFEVQSARIFKGLSESTFLTRSLSDQGVRLRVRKTPKQKAVDQRHEEMARNLKRMRHVRGEPDDDLPPQARGARDSISSQGQPFYDTNPYQGASAYGEERPHHRRRIGSASISPSTSIPPGATAIMGYNPTTPSSLQHTSYSQPSSSGPMLPTLMAPLRQHGSQFGTSIHFSPSPTQSAPMDTFHFTGGQQAHYGVDTSSGYAHNVSQAQTPTNTASMPNSSGPAHIHHSNSISVSSPETPVGAYPMSQYPSNTTASFPNGGGGGGGALPAYVSAPPHSNSSGSHSMPTSFSPDGYPIFETPYEYHQIGDHGLRTPQSPGMPSDAMGGFNSMNNPSYFSHIHGHPGMEPKHST